MWERTRLARIGHEPDDLAEVLQRGGNVAVQLYTQQPQAEVENLLNEVEDKGGWIDGYHAGSLAVLTFPVTTGFESIERVVDAYARRHDEEWFYGDIYDDQDQPLNWWVE